MLKPNCNCITEMIEESREVKAVSSTIDAGYVCKSDCGYGWQTYHVGLPNRFCPCCGTKYIQVEVILNGSKKG